MKTKRTLWIASSMIAALSASNALAHLEPKPGDGTEKCFAVAKAHKNDCASKEAMHSCVGQAKTDTSPNDWIKMPKGLCEKLVGSSLTAQDHKK